MTGGQFGMPADRSPDMLVRELCHDLIESAAAIGIFVRLADTEATGAGLAAGCQLRSRLEGIAAAAGQIVEICQRVLEQGGEPR
ncbi:MAG TPA: hypothetical protein VKV38_16925 [Trebonia sp.]|jgi:hypothetical protein|nr:hypothetical protein [Trebonia sp.]